MKTDQLIALIAEDAPVRTRLGKRVAASILMGIAISITLLVASIGIRTDMPEVIGTARVAFKILATLAFACLAIGMALSVGRPGARLGAWGVMLLGAITVSALAILVEIFSIPDGAWEARLVGNNARFCLMFIPVLALAPLIALIVALRHGAPDNPGTAGAVAGFASGTIASAIYALHCPDDSPLFVMTWYSLATVVMAAVGYVAGRQVLRW